MIPRPLGGRYSFCYDPVLSNLKNRKTELIHDVDERTDTVSSSPERRPGELVSGRCLICSGSRLHTLPFRYAFKDRFLHGTSCLDCSAVFLDPMPSDDEIAGLYQEEYFTECSDTCGAHGPAAYMEMAEDSDQERKQGAQRLDRRIRETVEQRGVLVEVGCGPGFFLAELGNLGWSVKGLEISEFAARHAQEKLGLDVRVGPIDSDSFPEGSANAVFMGDVLEHLPDPVVSLRNLRQWIAADGVLIVAIPSTLNLLSAKIGMAFYRAHSGFKTLKIPPYHLFEYTPRSVSKALEVAGFRVLSLQQSAAPISKMGLRGSRIENLGKVTLQYLAHLTTRLCNRGGDRLVIAATRTEEP